VISLFGRLPKRGEQIESEGVNFQVLRADSRRLHVLLVDKPKTDLIGVGG
jgi:magnesium and cobalt transporter